MKILVLIKEVPDMTTVKFDRERGVVDRAGADAEINPFDENALQAAVDLKEKYGDMEIVALTMGPPRAEASLKMAYAKGVNEAVLVTDRKFGGSDTFATSRILSAAIKQVPDVDMIICGEKSVDGDTAQVGAEVAEFLQIPHCYYVDQIAFEGEDKKQVKVKISNIGGAGQERVVQTPCLISVTKNAAMPKLPTVARMLESLEIPVTVYGIEDLEGLSEQNTGFKGSPTKVKRVVVPQMIERESVIYREDIGEFAQKLQDVMLEKGLV